VRPLIVSHNLDGGAGGAAHLLHRGLREAGVDSHLLVQFDSRGWEATHPVPTGRMSWRLAFRRGRLDRMFENLPLVGLEAMACGTPVVAFNADTGIVDIVDHRENGYLAAARDPEDLGRGIEWVVADPERHARLSGAARAKAQREYTLAVSARRYADLFTEVLAPA
jgi:glycosyltransferase involved in cell wall biosynthesis